MIRDSALFGAIISEYMVLRFKIHYHTNWGEQIKICGSLAELGDGNLQAAPFMTADADGHWFAEINLSDDRAASFSYKYALVREGTDAADWEWGAERQVTALESCDVTTFEDAWRPAQADENAWFSSAFTRVLMKRKTNGAGTAADVRAAGRSLFRF